MENCRNKHQDSIFAMLQEVMSEVLQVGVDLITLDSYLSEDLNADELDIVEVMQELEEAFDIKINDNEMSGISRKSIKNDNHRSISSWQLSSSIWGFRSSDYLVEDILLLICKKLVDKPEIPPKKLDLESKQNPHNRLQATENLEITDWEQTVLRAQINLKPTVEESLFQRLIRKCMGDLEQAERLISYELGRSPNSSREEAIQAALIRWEIDTQ
ncbi:MAG: hypothetical protein RLZZ511_1798 [Cyanobacteriota bacterium]